MKIDDPRAGLITLIFILVLSSATYKFGQDPNPSDQLRGENNASRLRSACYRQEKKIKGIGTDHPADSLPRPGSGELLYQKSELTIATMMLVLLMLVTEVGFRAGRRSLSGLNEFSKSQLGAISAGIIGLLALLLGFTFAMALSRFDLRKQLVMEESNAIQTTYLRSRLLPEPDKREIAGLLRRYIVARVDFHRVGIDRDRLREVNCRTEQLQSELWSHALTAVRKDDREVTTGLFIESLNEVIDLHTARLAARENHVPESVLLLLMIVALTAVLIVGYGCGLGRRRHFFSTTLQSILLVLVVTTIIDLDRPSRGLIRISQDSMTHLQDVLSNDSP